MYDKCNLAYDHLSMTTIKKADRTSKELLTVALANNALVVDPETQPLLFCRLQCVLVGSYLETGVTRE